MLAAEAGCFVFLGIIFLPIIAIAVNKIFPQLNLIEVGAIAMFIYGSIWVILQKLFGHDPID